MLTNKPGLEQALDDELIGFLTAVDASGQPQTSPVWFLRVGEDLIVYNREGSGRLASIEANPKVAMALRADWRGFAGVTLEGIAAVDVTLPSPNDLPAYLQKYGEEIEALDWTPETFSADFPVALRITVTRSRVWGLSKLNSGEYRKDPA